MPLDHFGKIAAAEIAFYTPILCISFFVTLKKGFRRREGWVYLFTFSLIRIIGASLMLATKLEKDVPIGLLIAADILQGIGLASLLLATLGFVTTIAQYGISTITRSTRVMRLLRVVILVGIILRIVGGTQQTPNNGASTISQGHTLSKVGSILFLLGYVSLLAIHVFLWGEKNHIPTNHRKLLCGISLALPPLFVRLLYTLLNTFASSSESRWSPINGDWVLFLIMDVIMEYLVVCVYVITAAFIPLDEDPKSQTRGAAVHMGVTSGNSA